MWSTLKTLFKVVFGLFIAWMLFAQFYAPTAVNNARNAALDAFQVERKSRVIVLIHRQETSSAFGVPLSSHISVEDSEALLRAIRLTPPDQPIDIILHTPGGLVLAAEQIAKALVDRKAKVTVFVPHYAMSGGTLIALAADEIVMDANAVLGPIDPQIGGMAAASIVKAVELKGAKNVSDETLILADMAQKARVQVAVFAADILSKHKSKEDAIKLATILSEGRWTHDFPITVEGARQLGLNVKTEMPLSVYALMDLYPQGGGGRPSVMYVPLRREGVDLPRPRERQNSGSGESK